MPVDNANRLWRRIVGSRGARDIVSLKPVRPGIMPWFAVGLAVCLVSFAFAFDFPPLTGRVVDQANVMTAQSRGDIEVKLKALEDELEVSSSSSPL